uniref:Uncharacterized protein n=1 Tax=Cannabis sativa TaxID=3483 RepID=A0A803QGI0_CANSA
MLSLRALRNDELEREAATTRVGRNDSPPNQPNTSARRPRGRPRGSRTRTHREAPTCDNHGNLTNSQDDQLGNIRDISVDKGAPKIQETLAIEKLDPMIQEPPVETQIVGMYNLKAQSHLA